MDWKLVKSLESLRTEFNRTWPKRKKAHDGAVGDARHARTESDHNPDRRGLVHAIDVTADLGDGTPMMDVIDVILDQHRSGADRRLTYIIFCPPGGEPTIWSARRGWKGKTYTESNRHDKHAHFSADDEPALEASAKAWHLEDAMALSEQDKKDLRKMLQEEIAKVVSLDGDPGERTYSLGGLVTTIERRSADDDQRFDDLKERLERIETTLAGPPGTVHQR